MGEAGGGDAGLGRVLRTPFRVALSAAFLALGVHSAAAQQLPVVVPAPATAAPAQPQESAAGRFIRDVAGDYRHFFSKETTAWYVGGAVASGLVHLADDDIREAFDARLTGGATYGGAMVQPAVAAGWWAVGHAIGSARDAAAGRDLLRAQINAATWTSLLKVVASRTRPDGGSYSFPSGHASATFATAMVLQEHYGWKLGVPGFAAATYTALSRVGADKHWASDVVFGAVVGMATARTVTLHVRNATLTLVPVVVPRGVAIVATRSP